MSDDVVERPEEGPATVDGPARAVTESAPAPLGAAPVTLVIEESPRPRITVSVGLYGDHEADRQWAEYGWGQLQEFMRRHPDFARQIGEIAKTDAAMAAAQLKAAERPTQPAQAANPSRGGAGRPANGPARAGGARGARGGNRGGRPGGGGGGGSRRDRYPPAEGWECDQCGGPCGIQAATGNMPADKVVCLGQCTEGRGFVYTVGWLDDD